MVLTRSERDGVTFLFACDFVPDEGLIKDEVFRASWGCGGGRTVLADMPMEIARMSKDPLATTTGKVIATVLSMINKSKILWM